MMHSFFICDADSLKQATTFGFYPPHGFYKCFIKSVLNDWGLPNQHDCRRLKNPKAVFINQFV